MGTTMVAPLVGAWIESINNKLMETLELVAPLVGAWIERLVSETLNDSVESLLL